MEMRKILQTMQQRKAASTAAILLTLAIGILIGTLISRGVRAAQNQAKAPDAQALELPSPVQLSTVFNRISNEISPAVVNINTESTVQAQSRTPRRRSPQAEPDQFENFFDRFFDLPFGQQQPELKQRSLGSGVIVDPNGYILTNDHVVSRAEKIKVKLHDDPKLYDARVVGADSETDLAVIKIDADHPLPAAKVGNSDGTGVGDWVLAIGSPFGLDETVTAGIISAKRRDLGAGSSSFQRFIQTDAAINPGNSGGPLVNMKGEVIGINTAIATGTGSYAGVGFALPSNVAVDVYNQLVKAGKVTRGSLGVTFQPDPSPVLLRSFGAESGVVITGIQPNGPAEAAGLKQGDVIVSIDGKPVKNGDDLISVVAGAPVGEPVAVRYLRNKQEQQAQVTIGDRSKVFAALLNPAEGQEAPSAEGAEAKFGVSIQNITPEMASRLGIDGTQGVLVTSVETNSFAEEAGLQRGDVILQVNQQPVNRVDDVLRIQRGLQSRADVVFLVRRGQGNQSVTLYLAGTLP